MGCAGAQCGTVGVHILTRPHISDLPQTISGAFTLARTPFFFFFWSNCAMERKDLSSAICTRGELLIQLPKEQICQIDLLLGAPFQSFFLMDLSDVTDLLISPHYFFTPCMH